MPTITLKNDFHNTEARVRVSLQQGGADLTLRQVNRARKTLCGIDSCSCADGPGSAAGCRGPQEVTIEPGYRDGREYITVWATP